MDREKQKKLEKEKMEKERAEMANYDSDMVEEGGDGHRLPHRSKFVSIFFITCLQGRNLLRLLWQLLSQRSLTRVNVH